MTYNLTDEELAEIDAIFTFHPVQGDQANRYQLLRQEARDLAVLIHGFCPRSRERSLAITNLQQAVMWANASIAIREAPIAEDSDD